MTGFDMNVPRPPRNGHATGSIANNTACCAADCPVVGNMNVGVEAVETVETASAIITRSHGVIIAMITRSHTRAGNARDDGQKRFPADFRRALTAAAALQCSARLAIRRNTS